MRTKIDCQDSLDFSPACLKITEQYHERYRQVDRVLMQAPEVLRIFHQSVIKTLNKPGQKRRAKFTSDQTLRAILVMEIEGLPYRDTVVRIDDSHFLRRFIRVFDGAVMDYTFLCKAYKAIPAHAWKKMNDALRRHAVDEDLIHGTSLRVDTTAVETNVHYPTDSGLLWDSYRTFSRLVKNVRKFDSNAVGSRRLQDRQAKRLMLKISRQSNRRSGSRERLKEPYCALLKHVSRILDWSKEVREVVRTRLATNMYSPEVAFILMAAIAEMDHFEPLVRKVMEQTSRRVLLGEQVPNSEKLFSIFEPHTELLIRGKAGKPIEFGHMVLLQQTEEKFITGYDVFEKRPTDESLVDSILEKHEKTFGQLPEALAADKGFYKSMDVLHDLEKRISHVSIAKKGKRTSAQVDREHHPIFRELQRFRAGIEGTISVLKRVFKMSRCLYRSWNTYSASIGCHVFTHNLINLAGT